MSKIKEKSWFGISESEIPEKDYKAWYSAAHLKAYPNLYKLLSKNRRRYYLYLMSLLEIIQNGTNFAHGFVSERYLAEKFNTSPAWANKILNFFCVLKILSKKRQGDKDRIKWEDNYLIRTGRDPEKAITYQIAPRNETYLAMIDARAAVILEKNLSISAISWEAVRSCFGEDEANELYIEERERGVIPQMYEAAFNETLMELTSETGWTTKEALVHAVMQISGDNKRTVEQRFMEFIPSLSDKGYSYKRTSKQDAQSLKYDLPISRFLIFKLK